MKRKRRSSPPQNGENGNSRCYDGAEVWRMFQMEITWAPMKSRETERLPRRIKRRMEELHPLVHGAPAQVLDELRKLVSQHPRVECLQNWLCCCLRLLNRTGEAREMAEAIFRKFPDYVFGRTTFAELQLEEGDFEGAQGTLGGPMATLPGMFPERRRFHISEVRHWFFVQGKLNLLCGRIEGGRSCREFLHQIEPDSGAVRELDRLLLPENLALLQISGGLSKLKNLASRKKPADRRQPRGSGKARARLPMDEHPDLFAGWQPTDSAS